MDENVNDELNEKEVHRKHLLVCSREELLGWVIRLFY